VPLKGEPSCGPQQLNIRFETVTHHLDSNIPAWSYPTIGAKKDCLERGAEAEDIVVDGAVCVPCAY
jgi:hypothetical protein